MTITLVTGGARSGKSAFAQEMATRSGRKVLFVATAQAGDDEMRRRIEQHRRSRPPSWRTLEATTDVGNQIIGAVGDSELVVVDCITLLVSNAVGEFVSEAGDEVDEELAAQATSREIQGLLDCFKRVAAQFILVTNEVGLGLVPDNKLGRVYRDLLGTANRVLAGAADTVYFMVSGLPVLIKPQGPQHRP